MRINVGQDDVNMMKNISNMENDKNFNLYILLGSK